MNNRVVLLSSAGTGTAFASALSLRRNWGSNVTIITADSNPRNLVTSSLFCDKHYQVPLNNDLKYKKSLEKILLEENADTYVPFIDHEIYIGAMIFEEAFNSGNLAIQVKKPHIADLCDDKYQTYIFLQENNVPTPETKLIDSKNIQKKDFIIKPRRGFGSQIEKLTDKTDDCLEKYDCDHYLIQRECVKPEITVDVSYDKESNYFVYVCRERLEIKTGVCTKARLFYDDEIEKIAHTIAIKLELNSFCFQLMKYKGDWVVTDVNARLGAGTALSVAAGLDFFSAMFAILWKEDPSIFFKPLKRETFVTRQYVEFVMNA